MVNDLYLSVKDILGFMMMYKELSYNFYSYLHKHSKGLESRRLSAKIASDENQLRYYYKKLYNDINGSYSEQESDIVESLYLTLLDKPIIPMHNHEWKYISKNLLTYKNLYETFLNFSNAFIHFLMKIHNRFDEDNILKTLKNIISREESYKRSLKDILEKLYKMEYDYDTEVV